MRIAFISACRKESKGGHVQAAQGMARAFAREHDVLLIYPGVNPLHYRESTGLAICELQSAGEGDACFPALLQGSLRTFVDTLNEFRPEIVHAHDFPTIGVIGQAWARMHGVPFLHTAHLLADRYLDFGASEVVGLLGTRLAERLVDAATGRFYENCDAIIVPNSAGAESFCRVGYTGRIYVIPNGRDLAKYGASQFADLSAPRRMLTFIGWISRRKNQCYLAEAMRQLPRSYQLRIIGGTFDPSYRLELERYIEDHRLDNVTLTGPLEHDLIPGYLERTHVFVSASRMEVQSLSVIEALASGTPVVGLTNETLDELVDNSIGRRLPADATPEEFAQAIISICEQPQSAYDEMCRLARARVQAFDWQHVVSQTIVTYQELLLDRSPISDSHATGPNDAIVPVGGSAIGKVSKATWLLAAIMTVGSSVLYAFMRPLLALPRLRKKRRLTSVSAVSGARRR